MYHSVSWKYYLLLEVLFIMCLNLDLTASLFSMHVYYHSDIVRQGVKEQMEFSTKGLGPWVCFKQLFR